MNQTVREFSSVGPCITLGEFVKRTDKSISYLRGGHLARKSGHAVASGLVHTEPCPSCRDHAHTQYPIFDRQAAEQAFEAGKFESPVQAYRYAANHLREALNEIDRLKSVKPSAA